VAVIFADAHARQQGHAAQQESAALQGRHLGEGERERRREVLGVAVEALAPQEAPSKRQAGSVVEFFFGEVGPQPTPLALAPPMPRARGFRHIVVVDCLALQWGMETTTASARPAATSRVTFRTNRRVRGSPVTACSAGWAPFLCLCVRKGRKRVRTFF